MLNNDRGTSTVNFGDHHHRSCRGRPHGVATLSANFNTQVTRHDMQHRAFLQAVIADDFALQRHALRPLDRFRHNDFRFFDRLRRRLGILLLALLRLFRLFASLAGSLFLLRLFDFLLAAFFQLLDESKHRLLVLLKLLECAALHVLVMLQAHEHLFLATHLRNKSLFFCRLLGAQQLQI